MRSEVLEHPSYYAYREELIAFLEAQEPEGARKRMLGDAEVAPASEPSSPGSPSRPTPTSSTAAA